MSANNINILTVYLGSSGRCRPVFKESAQKLGDLIGEMGKSLVYGGMDAGLMGIVANKALSAGAKVTGIIPKNLQDSQRIHPNLSETILVPDLWERKRKMFKRADAIIALAGGFGTIDEVLEALYWADLGSHVKPVILVNTENYWDYFIRYIKNAHDLSHEHLIIADSPQDVFTKLESWSAPSVNGNPDNLPHFEDDIIIQDIAKPIIFKNTSIKQSYILATALGLKQLDKHQRHIGLLNPDGRFDSLICWINSALKEHFITDRCPDLFSVAKDMDTLKSSMDKQKNIHIDLDNEKWGKSETASHIEITQKD